METLSELYRKIGSAGVVLVIIGFIGTFLAIKNILYLWFVGRDFNKIIGSANHASGCRKEILESNINNPLISVIYDLIESHGNHSDDLKAEVAYLFYRKFKKVIRDVTMIRVVSVISPLLGLLGTLLGLLGVFKVMSTTSAIETSRVLAAGIWEAILTTIMGLVLAIPALVVYYVLNLTMRSFSLTAIEYGYRFLGYTQSCRLPEKE